MRILIAGCGYVGLALGADLATAGHTVWGLRRNAAELPVPLLTMVADLTEPGSLSALPEGLDGVAYAVAAERHDEAAYRAAYVTGLANLLAALDAAGQRPRVVFTSSTAVYAQDDGAWVDEASPTEPVSFSGRVLLEAEALALGWGDAVVLRAGGIYGPERTSLADSARDGTATLSEQPLHGNRIHRDDCAGALRHLLAMGAPLPVYLGVDDEPADRNDVLRWLAARHGVTLRTAPGRPARPAGSKRCSNARLRAAGYRFRYPTFREGYAAL